MYIVTLISKTRHARRDALCIERIYEWWYYDEPTPSYIHTLCNDLTDATFLWHCEHISWVADDDV